MCIPYVRTLGMHMHAYMHVTEALLMFSFHAQHACMKYLVKRIEALAILVYVTILILSCTITMYNFYI